MAPNWEPYLFCIQTYLKCLSTPQASMGQTSIGLIVCGLQNKILSKLQKHILQLSHKELNGGLSHARL